MDCTLCGEPIANHSPEFHSLKLNDERTVEICDACARAFVAWQGEKLARLFPTRAMKSWQERRGRRR